MRTKLIIGFILCAALFSGPGGAVRAQTVLVARNSVWRYDASGIDQGTGWRNPGYLDSGWPTGAGILGYGEAYITTVIPYGPDPLNKYITSYFRHTFTLPVDPSTLTQLTLALNYDDGCAIYLNGTEVARLSLPAGTLSFGTLASSHEGGSYESVDLSSAIGLLSPGDNLLAVEVHQRDATSSDCVWDAELTYSSSQTEFMWSGAVGPDAVRVKARMLTDGVSVRLATSTSADLTGALFLASDVADAATNDQVVDLAQTGLAPSTLYYYALEVDGLLDTEQIGSFRTHPPPGPASFTVAYASCATTGSAHSVFTTIAGLDPLLFIHMGDLHYQNIAVNDPDFFRAAYRTVMASPTQSELYRSVATAYVWDDHDYGPNNSDSTAPGRIASRLTYQEYVPHYPLAAGSGDVPIYQTFTIGRVKFILTDSRSARSPWSAPDNASKTMLGADQKAWFKSEMLSAQGVNPLIVWVNTLPWIGVSGDDGWHLYTTERHEIAEFLKANNSAGLCMLSGDAHMIAIDDGSHSDYATGGGAAFPVMHAGSLDRGGSVKGGPYSEGTYPGGGQFGLMTVTDTGGPRIGIEWSGRNAGNTEIVALTYTVSVADGTICMCACHADPQCDGLTNVLDVVQTINVAFKGAAPLTDPRPFCPQEPTDVDCSGVTNVLDVVRMVNVAFKGMDAATEFCNPCN